MFPFYHKLQQRYYFIINVHVCLKLIFQPLFVECKLLYLPHPCFNYREPNFKQILQGRSNIALLFLSSGTMNELRFLDFHK